MAQSVLLDFFGRHFIRDVFDFERAICKVSSGCLSLGAGGSTNVDALKDRIRKVEVVLGDTRSKVKASEDKIITIEKTLIDIKNDFHIMDERLKRVEAAEGIVDARVEKMLCGAAAHHSFQHANGTCLLPSDVNLILNNAKKTNDIISIILCGDGDTRTLYYIPEARYMQGDACLTPTLVHDNIMRITTLSDEVKIFEELLNTYRDQILRNKNDIITVNVKTAELDTEVRSILSDISRLDLKIVKIEDDLKSFSSLLEGIEKNVATNSSGIATVRSDMLLFEKQTASDLSDVRKDVALLKYSTDQSLTKLREYVDSLESKIKNEIKLQPAFVDAIDGYVKYEKLYYDCRKWDRYAFGSQPWLLGTSSDVLGFKSVTRTDGCLSACMFFSAENLLLAAFDTEHISAECSLDFIEYGNSLRFRYTINNPSTDIPSATCTIVDDTDRVLTTWDVNVVSIFTICTCIFYRKQHSFDNDGITVSAPGLFCEYEIITDSVDSDDGYIVVKSGSDFIFSNIGNVIGTIVEIHTFTPWMQRAMWFTSTVVEPYPSAYMSFFNNGDFDSDFELSGIVMRSTVLYWIMQFAYSMAYRLYCGGFYMTDSKTKAQIANPTNQLSHVLSSSFQHQVGITDMVDRLINTTLRYDDVEIVVSNEYKNVTMNCISTNLDMYEFFTKDRNHPQSVIDITRCLEDPGGKRSLINWAGHPNQEKNALQSVILSATPNATTASMFLGSLVRTNYLVTVMDYAGGNYDSVSGKFSNYFGMTIDWDDNGVQQDLEDKWHICGFTDPLVCMDSVRDLHVTWRPDEAVWRLIWKRKIKKVSLWYFGCDTHWLFPVTDITPDSVVIYDIGDEEFKFTDFTSTDFVDINNRKYHGIGSSIDIPVENLTSDGFMYYGFDLGNTRSYPVNPKTETMTLVSRPSSTFDRQWGWFVRGDESCLIDWTVEFKIPPGGTIIYCVTYGFITAEVKLVATDTNGPFLFNNEPSRNGTSAYKGVSTTDWLKKFLFCDNVTVSTNIKVNAPSTPTPFEGTSVWNENIDGTQMMLYGLRSTVDMLGIRLDDLESRVTIIESSLHLNDDNNSSDIYWKILEMGSNIGFCFSPMLGMGLSVADNFFKTVTDSRASVQDIVFSSLNVAPYLMYGISKVRETFSKRPFANLSHLVPTIENIKEAWWKHNDLITSIDPVEYGDFASHYYSEVSSLGDIIQVPIEERNQIAIDATHAGLSVLGDVATYSSPIDMINFGVVGNAILRIAGNLDESLHSDFLKKKYNMLRDNHIAPRHEFMIMRWIEPAINEAGEQVIFKHDVRMGVAEHTDIATANSNLSDLLGARPGFIHICEKIVIPKTGNTASITFDREHSFHDVGEIEAMRDWLKMYLRSPHHIERIDKCSLDHIYEEFCKANLDVFEPDRGRIVRRNTVPLLNPDFRKFLLENLRDIKWDYNLVTNNCQHFVDAVADFVSMGKVSNRFHGGDAAMKKRFDDFIINQSKLGRCLNFNV